LYAHDDREWNEEVAFKTGMLDSQDYQLLEKKTKEICFEDFK
jgi:hypothetical protein